MIKRKDIYLNEWAYAHHCRADTLRGAIRSLKLFSDTWPEDPQRVIRNMREVLMVLHRMERKDAIRAAMRAKGGAA